ncbi:hypothetical protein IW140_004642 [Coemansia sp. RSA 1813]|nr:hypothetical protein EV178_004723 [Coemansia sp. RSA 1646]KAJ1770153.1 hypothetical protein LPJ74_003440 [Coemansia sp. RSA 1843]KAJ2087636.1 hypothetical protein IW138_004839 [Coemansia sp. RSA 986]KAJ2214380.1 hypothetical protein EV179_003045 [Coemansia sp. RSA 487]KAJ2567075.1 hypothetical protein IW140_004642 [Coemansia sp. RSA 1813]
MSEQHALTSTEPQAAAPAITSEKSIDELIREHYKPGAIYNGNPYQFNTLSEKRIRELCSAIRSKVDWITKMKNAEVRTRWISEATQQEPELTGKELDYVFGELEYYTTLHTSGNGIHLSPVEQVWISDSLIDKDTEEEVKRYAAKLENAPDREKDWHPNSNNQVLNLVHPSLFPIIYERSRILAKPIESPEAALQLKSFGECPGSFDKWRDAVAKISTDKDTEYYFPNKVQQSYEYRIKFISTKYCWLPTEFWVNGDGSSEVKSYINNLHPVRHKEFYPTVAKVFSKFVPLLEQVVTDLAYPRDARVESNAYFWHVAEDTEPEDYDASDYEDRHDEWLNSRQFVHPQPEPFVTPDRPTEPCSLRGRKLQAIFKMSNIQLTPDNPEYEGGSWHVEAMANERIIATGIYYYDVENITESCLAFRECVGYNIDYEQGEPRGVKLVYGLDSGWKDDEYLIQNVGQVETKNGRCIVFPNIYQHKVGGFKLADPTKPGHRKIFAFFFIDPSTRVPSTEIVPPQRQDWWIEAFADGNPINELPSLVQRTIYDNVAFPISLDDAKRIRLDLMAERTAGNQIADVELFALPFELCEH